MNDEQSGLKEILSEVGRAHLYGKVEAMLWFPEYYEKVWNPARILMTEVHGSGSVLQKLLSGKVFHFLGMTSVLRWREPRNHQISREKWYMAD